MGINCEHSHADAPALGHMMEYNMLQEWDLSRLVNNVVYNVMILNIYRWFWISIVSVLHINTTKFWKSCQTKNMS